MSTIPGSQIWLDHVRAEWNSRADAFNALSARNAAGEDRRVELAYISSALHLEAGSRLLDAGCGSGHFGIAFAERGCVVDGVDLSHEMIEHALSNATAAGVDATFSVGDLAHLDASDDVYDAIVARMVLQFSLSVSAVLDEFERVSKPTARFWLSVPGALAPMYKDSWQRFVSPQPRAVNNILPWELVHVLDDRGWTIHHQWGSFDTVAGQADNVTAHTQLDVATFPLPLQQAAATVWNVIASNGS